VQRKKQKTYRGVKMMPPLCYFLCYFNAALFFTFCVLGGYVIFHLFIVDRVFWKVFFLLLIAARAFKYYALYKALDNMIFNPDAYICFYQNNSVRGVTDTLEIVIFIVLFIFFMVSGKCSTRDKRL
jgi:hypothetical protein